MSVRHDGSAISPDDLFFADPPPEIGAILSASTDAKKGDEKSGVGCLASLAVLVAGILGFAVVMLLAPVNDPSSVLYAAGAGLASTVGTYLLMKRIRPRTNECSYLGHLGFARFERRGERVVLVSLVRFSEVANVEVRSTRYGKYGVATSALVEWSFMDKEGRQLARLAGMHWPDDPKRSLEYCFGARAHEAWRAAAR